MTPSDELKLRVLAAARQEPAPTRHQVGRRRALVLGASALVLGAFFFLLEGVHPGLRPAPFIWGTAAGYGLAALGLGLLVFGRRGAYARSRTALLGLALGTPLALVGWNLLWGALYPETRHPWPGVLGLVCFDLVLTAGALPVLALILALRGSDPAHPSATGAAVGGSVGSAAGLLITLSCQCGDPAHTLLGHVLPVALLTAVGGLGGGRLIGLARGSLRREPKA